MCRISTVQYDLATCRNSLPYSDGKRKSLSQSFSDFSVVWDISGLNKAPFWPTCPTCQKTWSLELVYVKNSQLCQCFRTTVLRVMTAYMNLGKVCSAKQNCGRKSKLNDRDRRKLNRIAATKRKTTLQQITSEMNTHLQNPAFTKTIQRERHASDIHGKVAISNSLVSPWKAMKRWQCHRDLQNWTQQQWEEVIWSVE